MDQCDTCVCLCVYVSVSVCVSVSVHWGELVGMRDSALYQANPLQLQSQLGLWVEEQL